MADEHVALALAGAGTKGAFEVGALRYLLAEAGVVPRTICATSAGAIIGTVLAQARTSAEFVARADQLRDDLLAMTATDLVFGKQPWLEAFDGTDFGRAVDDFVTVRNRPPVPADPDAEAAAGPAAPPPRRARHHRLHALTTVLEHLPAARRAKGELTGHLGSLLTLDPLEAALKGEADVGIASLDPAAVARSGLELRLTVTALGRGRTRYVTGDGTIVEADARTPVAGAGSGPVTVLAGLLASSSVPMVFEPRPLGDDVYVDGGVLQNVPVAASVALGADHVVAVLGAPVEDPPDERDFTAANFVSVFLRATSQISFFERQRANLATPLPEGVRLTVIAPTVDVVGAFEVSQGLMLLDMDYGWMRAAEVLADVDDATRAEAGRLSDAATAARERAWYLEEELWAAGSAAPDQLTRLRRTKAQVQAAVEARAELGLATPDACERWWEGFEVHAAARPAAVPASPGAG